MTRLAWYAPLIAACLFLGTSLPPGSSRAGGPAQDGFECRAKLWPETRLSREELPKKFGTVPRQALLEYFLGEVALADQHASRDRILASLTRYMVRSEVDEELRNFYGFMSWASKYEKWPKSRELKLKRVCGFYQRVMSRRTVGNR